MLCSNIEDAQMKATNLLGPLKDKPFPERLRTLGLPSLEHRKLRGDMVEVYKYLHGNYDVHSSTEQHSNHLYKQQPQRELQKAPEAQVPPQYPGQLLRKQSGRPVEQPPGMWW